MDDLGGFPPIFGSTPIYSNIAVFFDSTPPWIQVNDSISQHRKPARSQGYARDFCSFLQSFVQKGSKVVVVYAVSSSSMCVFSNEGP